MEYLECQGRYLQHVLGQTPMYTGSGHCFPVLNVLHLLHPQEYDINHVDLMPIIKILNDGDPFGLIVPKIHVHQRLKIERKRALKKVIGHDDIIFGFVLTDPLVVVLDSEQLQNYCR